MDVESKKPSIQLYIEQAAGKKTDFMGPTSGDTADNITHEMGGDPVTLRSAKMSDGLQVNGIVFTGRTGGDMTRNEIKSEDRGGVAPQRKNYSIVQPNLRDVEELFGDEE